MNIWDYIIVNSDLDRNFERVVFEGEKLEIEKSQY